MSAMDVSAGEVAVEAKRQLKDCSRVAIFANGEAIYANCTVLPGELQQLASTFTERDAAMQQGLQLEGRRYEVHRFHPPLIYGRSMADCEPETSTGIAVCRVDHSRLAGSRGGPTYVAVTFEQPHTSARIVPLLQEFAQGWLAAAPAGDVQ